MLSWVARSTTSDLTVRVNLALALLLHSTSDKRSDKYIVADNTHLLYYCTYVDMHLHWGSLYHIEDNSQGFSRLS